MIIYTIVKTQIDIAFATFIISRLAKNSSLKHFNTINQIQYYIAGRREKNIIFKREKKLKLVEYSDFNQVKDYRDQKSTTKFIYILDISFIRYISKKKAVVALSSIQVEYEVLSLAT